MGVPLNMQNTIFWASVSLSVVGLGGAFEPHADTAIIAAAWSGMLVTLALQAKHELSKDTALKIVSGTLAGIVTFAGGVKLANMYLAYSGVGTVPAMILNAGTNGVFTYLFGQAAARTFLEMSSPLSVESVVRQILLYLVGPFGEMFSAKGTE